MSTGTRKIVIDTDIENTAVVMIRVTGEIRISLEKNLKYKKLMNSGLNLVLPHSDLKMNSELNLVMPHSDLKMDL